jgi:hypothetical protein
MMLKNPFVVYATAFGSVLIIYQLGWSTLYPSLSMGMLLFFGATFLAAAFLAVLISPAVRQAGEYQPGLMPWYAVIFVVGTFAIEIALAGGIPLILVMRGAKFFALEADASHLHVFTFWSVFSTIRFADFLYSRRPRYLCEAALPIIFYALMVYRGPAIMSIASWGFVFIIRYGIGIRSSAWAAIAVVLVFLGNGLLGELRSPGQATGGGPSESYRNSGIPKTFFWSYLYLTLPLANFQHTVNSLNEQKGTVAEFVASDLLPDTFSKRILPLLNDGIASNHGNLVSRDLLYSWEQPMVVPGLNTATIFGRSYGFFGWIGPAVMFVVLASFIILYLILIRHSPYCVPCLALLNTLVTFCIINNMIASAAMIPQLVWPLLLPPYGRLKSSRLV